MLLTIGDGTDCRSTEDIQFSRNLAKRFRSNLQSNETYNWMLSDLHINPNMQDSFSMGNATLKLWLLDSFDENGVPLCLRSMKLFEKIEEETLTTLAVNEPSHLLLFGCASGRIYSLFGDLLRTKKIAPIALPPNFTTPITCLAISTPLSVLFPRGSHSQDANHLVVFVATQSRLGSYAFPLEPKKPAVFQALDDAAGCAANCGCVDKSGNFVEPRCGCEVDGGSRGRSVRVLRDGARAKLSAGGIEAVCVLASRQRGGERGVQRGIDAPPVQFGQPLRGVCDADRAVGAKRRSES